MKQSQRYELIDQVARELQARFKTYELNSYLKSMGVSVPHHEGPISSKWVYSKGILVGEELETVLAIAEDLEMDTPSLIAGATLPPSAWAASTSFRLFISHVAKHKDKAKRLSACLEPYSISGFVAHEDIEPTKEWEQELRKALHTMDAFVSMHTPGFRESNWTQQEVGFAVGSGKKIITFRMGEDPSGFLSKDQSLLHNRRSAEAIAKEIDRLLMSDPLTQGRLLEAKRASLPKADKDEIPF